MRELVSPWKEHLKSFYEYKKLCGYVYEKEESPIYLFDRYYASLGINEILFTRDIVEPFIYLKEGERIANQSFRATVLRQFGKYLFINGIIDNIYIIPPISQKGEKEYIPYIFEQEELKSIVSFLEEYQNIVYENGYNSFINVKRAVTISIKILMSTGMRVGELLNMKRKDVDFENSLFIIEIAKNSNQRIIPVSDTLIGEIIEYLDKTPFIIEENDYLLQSEPSHRLNVSNIRFYYRKALNAANIRHVPGKGPRIHDFRHTFAVMSLTQLQRSEENINLSLSYLSSYLGHKSIRETQKYIWLTPSLFEETRKKMEQYSSFIMDIFDGEKFDED